MSQQTFKRGKVPMRFKPTRGIGTPNPNRSATNARMEAIGEKTSDERVSTSADTSPRSVAPKTARPDFPRTPSTPPRSI